ncbi:hypothetical protein AAVH_16533 [Aphelenchoides avenae]|nr:hypothetical protein AAVH_16533 [Aphelenchus avenae]
MADIVNESVRTVNIVKECCDDDLTVWLRFETWLWAVLLLVQLSMVAFMIIHGRKDKTFRQAFYAFFVAVTFVDCALALLRPSQELWGTTIFGTSYDDPQTEEEDPWTHELRSYPTVRGTLNMIAEHVIVSILRHAQPLFLTAIAVNRFTAFAFPLKHASMWRTRTVVVAMISLAVMAIFLGAALTVICAIRDAVQCWGLTARERAKLFCWPYDWAFDLVGSGWAGLGGIGLDLSHQKIPPSSNF